MGFRFFCSLILIGVAAQGFAQSDTSDVFTIVEEFPIFGNCKSTTLPYLTKKECSDSSLIFYIHQHLEYPQAAYDAGIEGLVVIQGVISREGKLGDVKVMTNRGYGLEEAAMQVIRQFEKDGITWTPGRSRNIPLKTKVNFPFRFNLEYNSKSQQTPPVFPTVDTAGISPYNQWLSCQRAVDRFVQKHHKLDKKAYENRENVALFFEVGINGKLLDIHTEGPKSKSKREAVRLFRWMNRKNIRWIPATKAGEKIHKKCSMHIKF